MFAGDSLVLSKRGYIRACDLHAGDMVLCHDKQYHRVVKAADWGMADGYKLDIVGSNGLFTTPGSRFYARRRVKYYDKASRRYRSRVLPPKWVPAAGLAPDGSLFVNDDEVVSSYVGCPVNRESIIPEWNGIDLPVNQGGWRHVGTLDMSDPYLWYLAGRYLSSGWLRKDRKGDYRMKFNGVVVRCGKRKLDSLKAHIPGCFHYTVSEERTGYKLYFCNTELAYFMGRFGEGVMGKRLPGFVFDLPVCLLKEFLNGYLDRDGGILEDGTQYKFGSVNQELLYDVSQCVMKCYHIPCSISCVSMSPCKVIEGRELNQHRQFKLTFKPGNTGRSSFYEDGYVWYQVHGGEFLDGRMDVYDIEVEGCHSLVVNNACVYDFNAPDAGGI